MRLLEQSQERLARAGLDLGRVPLSVHLYREHSAFAVGTGREQPTWVKAVARPGAIHLWSPWSWPEPVDEEAIVGILAHEWIHVWLIGEGRALDPCFEEGIASLLSGQQRQRASRSELRAFLKMNPTLDPFDTRAVSPETYYTACQHWAASVLGTEGLRRLDSVGRDEMGASAKEAWLKAERAD